MVQRITVKVPGDQVNFLVQLPCPVREITAVAAIPSWEPANPKPGEWGPTSTGNLSLRRVARGDIFLQFPVQMGFPHDLDFLPPGIPHPAQDMAVQPFGRSQGCFHMTDVDGAGDGHTLRGYYKDSIWTIPGMGGSYTVTIVIHYRKAR